MNTDEFEEQYDEIKRQLRALDFADYQMRDWPFCTLTSTTATVPMVMAQPHKPKSPKRKHRYLASWRQQAIREKLRRL
jgi:hypothetical protein